MVYEDVNDKVKMVKMNAGLHLDLAKKNGLDKVPAIQLFNQGSLVATMDPTRGAEPFKDWVNRRMGLVDEAETVDALQEMTTFPTNPPEKCEFNTFVLSVDSDDSAAVDALAELVQSKKDFDSSCFVVTRSKETREALLSSVELDDAVPTFGDSRYVSCC